MLAINFVSFLPITAIASTNTIVAIVLINCSLTCIFATTFIIFFPLKYPLKTEFIETKNIDGASAIKVYSASGILKILFDIYEALKYIMKLPRNPIIPKI